MEKTVQVPNIGCNGCVRTIQNEVSQVPGVMSVRGNSSSKQVTIVWDEAAGVTWETIRAKLIEIDYSPAE